MTGNDGPVFEHNPPDLPDPEDPPIVVQATLTALDDYFQIRTNAVEQSLNVLVNDRGPGGHPTLRVTSVSATKLGGQVTIGADGRSLIYTPAATEANYDPLYGGLYAGTDSFFYIVEDSEGRISKANVSVRLVTPLRGPQNDRYWVLEDEHDIELDVLLNDEEFSGGTIVDVAQPSQGGTVTVAADGRKLLFTPATGFKGNVSFTYTVEFAEGHTASTWVTIHVQSRLEARYDSFEIDVNSPQIELDVLANDELRGNPEPPRIVDIQLPENFAGTLTISEDGKKLLFTPAQDFIGHLSFTYTARYGPAEHHVVSASATIAVIDPFLAVDNWYMVDPGSSGNLLDVQANDPELRHFGGSFYGPRIARSITSVSAGSAGGVIEIVDGGRTIRYTPAAGFTGDETFEYTVVDETGHEDTATVTMHVAFEEADPFNLPRFRHSGELAQFLIDEAVQRFAREFSQQSRQFIPYSGSGGIGGDREAWNLDSVDAMTRLYANGVSLSSSYSTTNVQHAGIDEADVVETDGSYIYALSGGRLTIVDVRDTANPTLVSVTQFADPVSEMYLQGDRLTLISRGSASHEYGDGVAVSIPYGTLAETEHHNAVVIVLDVSDRGEPELVERTAIEGHIVDSRAIGERVHLVTQQHVEYPRPQRRVLAEYPAEDGSGSWQVLATETLDEYIARVRDTLADQLPQFRTYNAAGELVASGPLSDVNQIHKPISSADRVLMSLVTIDVGDDAAGPVTSTGIFTNSSDRIYVSYTAVYVLRTDYPYSSGSNSTRILQFEFADDGTTSLEAAGRVTGQILNQFSLDEHEGRLRIVTTQTTRNSIPRTARTQNHLFVLERIGTELKVVGAVENLAPTETVKSVRFMGDRAYVVTFRVVDPLFAIDLSDPTMPRVAGALKIPGYSDYLHPVGDDYLIGFGRDADEITGVLGAAQVSLFYVGDLDNPQLVDRMTLSGADWVYSEAFFDHHAIAYFAEHQVLSIPISWHTTSEEDIDGDGITDRWNYESRSAAFVFQVDVDGGDAGLQFSGRIDHDSTVRRSARVGDALVTISDEEVQVHEIDDVQERIGRVYIGRLPTDDYYAVLEDSGPTELNVLENDRPNESGQPPAIVSVTQPVRPSFWIGSAPSESEIVGTVEIADNGRSVVFTPHANFFGTATFTYTLFDEVRGHETATVTITVEGVPDEIEAVDDEFEVPVGSTSVQLDVLSNDVDPDRGGYSPLYFIDTTYAVGRVATIVPSDIMLSRSVETSVDSAIAYSTNLVLMSDWKLLDVGLRIVSVGTASHGGTVEIDQFGSTLIYTPAEGFAGIETFAYAIEAADGRTAMAMVTIRVGEVAEVATEPRVSDPIAPMAEEPDVRMSAASAAVDAALPLVDFREAQSGAGRTIDLAPRRELFTKALAGVADTDLLLLLADNLHAEEHPEDVGVRLAFADLQANGDANLVSGPDGDWASELSVDLSELA